MYFCIEYRLKLKCFLFTHFCAVWSLNSFLFPWRCQNWCKWRKNLKAQVPFSCPLLLGHCCSSCHLCKWQGSSLPSAAWAALAAALAAGSSCCCYQPAMTAVAGRLDQVLETASWFDKNFSTVNVKAGVLSSLHGAVHTKYGAQSICWLSSARAPANIVWSVTLHSSRWIACFALDWLLAWHSPLQLENLKAWQEHTQHSNGIKGKGSRFF